MTEFSAEIQNTVGKVAVIGMAGRYPAAGNIEEFWQNLKQGKECITFFPLEELLAAGIDPVLLAHPNYVRAQGVYQGTYLFDAPFFGYTPAEAEFLDPQHRALLECSWEAIEQAGYDPWTYSGRIGMFAGCGQTHYLFELLSMPDIWEHTSPFALPTYNDKDFLAARVGYDLNLRGPCVTVQTACSTSLVSIVMACQSVLSYQSDICLAGGVTLSTKECAGYLYQEGGIASPDGHCRTFDADAKGIVGSSGVGVVVLKRLEDAIKDRDTIHAVVVGMGLNNDGASRIGFTAPGRAGQAEVIKDAIEMAGINPETIGFVECHGTGTPIGDPIEVAALTRAFRAYTQKKHFCAVGSVKTNIGHSDTAAGVAGFIKAVLALRHKIIPPTLHFQRPNPEIDFASSPFYVNTTLQEWPPSDAPRRAGVTSLGAGGTNAHVILEENLYPAASGDGASWSVLVWSARTDSALKVMTANLLGYLGKSRDDCIDDVAYTLQVGRQAFLYRRALVCRDHSDAIESLQEPNSGRILAGFSELTPLTFLFPGQGSQYVNMGRKLYLHVPRFRHYLDTCAEILQKTLAIDIRTILFAKAVSEIGSLLDEVEYTTPILFSMEYSLAKLWMDWGVKPDSMVGHSLGEYVAACLAGVLTLQDALRLVAARGLLIQRLPRGSMLSVVLPEEELLAASSSIAGLSVAVVNGPSACVASGSTEAILQLERDLARREIPCRRLRVSHAIHSAMMDPILEDFRTCARNIELHEPSIPYLSNLTGTWIAPAQATSPDYWVDHLRHTVRFSACLTELFKLERRIFLEVGPGNMLSSLIMRHPARAAGLLTLSSLPHPKEGKSDDVEFFLTALAQLWLQGIPVDWEATQSAARRRIPLPTYPFEKQYYRVSPVKNGPMRVAAYSLAKDSAPVQENVSADEHTDAAAYNRPHLSCPFVAPRNELEHTIACFWENTLGMRGVGVEDNFIELGGDSLLAIELARRISKQLVIPFTVENVYEAPTIAGCASLAARLQSQSPGALEYQPRLYWDTDISGLHQKGSSSGRKSERASTPECASPEQPSYPGLNQPLVHIRTTGPRQALFFVHPGGGGVTVYQQLAKYLDPDHPIYAFQCHILGSNKGHPLIPVERMASHYIRFLKEIQPAAPYLLAGWSAGGVIAFEMGVQLQRAQQEISLIGIFDAAPYLRPDAEPKDAEARLAEDIIAAGEALATRAGEKFTLTRSDLEHLSEEHQFERFLEELRNKDLVPPAVDAQALRALLETFRNTNKALEFYAPDMYHGRVLVLRAADVTPELLQRTSDIYADPSFGWQQYCSRPVDVRYVPGDHMHMAVEPNIRTLGAVFQNHIDQLDKLHRNSAAQPALKQPDRGIRV
ncbi:MAG TPA: beta-ketoacyl synthase N-terminal-like domain-containing protein [Candidatus Angelobacter sp.]